MGSWSCMFGPLKASVFPSCSIPALGPNHTQSEVTLTAFHKGCSFNPGCYWSRFWFPFCRCLHKMRRGLEEKSMRMHTHANTPVGVFQWSGKRRLQQGQEEVWVLLNHSLWGWPLRGPWWWLGFGRGARGWALRMGFGVELNFSWVICSLCNPIQVI